MIKKRTLLRSSILILLVLLLIVGGNARALDQLTLYLPIVVDGTAETPSPTTPPPAGDTGIVVITTIFYNGAGSNEPDEYVEIRNDDTKPIQLQNWTLRDIAAVQVFTFPSFIMEPGEVCRVYTNENHPEWCGFSYGSGNPIWNNGGDTSTVKDVNGNLIDEYIFLMLE